MQWKIVEKDGNPTKEGMYFVILTAPNVESHGMNPDGTYKMEYLGGRTAAIDARYYAKGPARGDSWIMCDQDENAPFYWTEQTGSSFEETVYAWLDIAPEEIPPLPEGVVYEENTYEECRDLMLDGK